MLIARHSADLMPQLYRYTLRLVAIEVRIIVPFLSWFELFLVSRQTSFLEVSQPFFFEQEASNCKGFHLWKEYSWNTKSIKEQSSINIGISFFGFSQCEIFLKNWIGAMDILESTKITDMNLHCLDHCLRTFETRRSSKRSWFKPTLGERRSVDVLSQVCEEDIEFFRIHHSRCNKRRYFSG